MSKMFVHYSGTVENFKKLSNIADYNNKIVFIKGGTDGKGAAIYTHGEYYTTAHDIEAAVANLKIIKGVLVNGDSSTLKVSSSHDGVINFSAGDQLVCVSTDPTGIKFSVSDAVKTAVANSHTHSNKGVLDGITSEKVSGWDTASANTHNHSNKAVLDTVTADIVSNSHSHSNKTELDKIANGDKANWDDAYNKRHEHTNKTLLDSITDGKVQQWDAAQPNVIETVKVNGTALEVSNKEVNVVIPAASVTGVKAGDKVLKLNGTELETAVSFGKENIDGVEYLVVRGLNNAELGKVPTAEFTADSFLDDVEIKEGKINFVWDMADGSTKTDSVDLSDYILPYSEGDGIDISDKNVVSVEIDAASESFLTVGADGVKLAGVQDAINTAVAGKNVEAEGDDYISASAANNKVSVSASLKTKDAVALAETALQEVTKEDSDYATVTVGAKTADHKQSIKVDVKVQAVASASAAKQGFADANDVRLEIEGAKSYADDLFDWEEL